MPMPQVENVPRRNGILAAIRDPDAAAHLIRELEQVHLKPRRILGQPGDESTHVYFLTSGIVSRLGVTQNGRSLELACTGREGAVGVFGLFGLRVLPYRLTVQLEGEALRIPTRVLERRVADVPGLLERIARYGSVLTTQLAQSAVCARFHSSRQRLCRWLVIASARSHLARLPWSHEWLAEMVGGPRSSITDAASRLRDDGVLAYRRGGVEIRDMTRLRRSACECAWVVERAVEQFMREVPEF